jgi:hypothetical protein
MRTKSSPPVYSVLLVSAAALGYEVLLMRLFSIIQWHHFAYMVISLALLGYGASGTFLTLMRNRLLANFTRAFAVNATLFGISSIGCFLLAQELPFNALEMFWYPGQWLLLLLSYLLLFIPFFFAANCICLTFARFGDQIPRVYAFDLIGAGIGALGVILALYLQSPLGVLRTVAGIGMLAAALVMIENRSIRRWSATVPYLSLVLIIALLPDHWIQLQLSEYKSLSQTLRVTETRVIDERSSPLGLVTLVESPRIPLRLAPGLSLNSSSEPPEQIGIFIDGDAPSALTRYDGHRESLAYLDYQTSALPYHLSSPGRVLILGMGGGSGILQATFHGTDRIEAVEINPQLAQIFQKDYAAYSGWHWLQQHTRIHLGEARGFIASGNERFDLIQISLLDSANAASGGVYALNESYLYTREAIAEYLQHLHPGGLLSITRWAKLPPRDGLKLFATVIDALHRSGVQDPAGRMLMIRGWNTSTLIVKNGQISDQDIQQLIAFCRERSFDLVYYPGISRSQTNRYNILAEPYLYQGATALLSERRQDYLSRYKFDIRSTTDDRPYFFNFFKWEILPDILAMYRQGGVSLLELGYPILVLTLVQALLVSVVLILLPLGFIKRKDVNRKPKVVWRVMGYFLAIGLAFLFIEIAFIQKFILFLAHPIYAVAVVLCGFLIFSGMGSHYASRLVGKAGSQRLFPVVLVLGLIALSYLWLLPALFSWLADMPTVLKMGITLLLIAPLAFCMGIPFPMGLTQVARQMPQLVPWAWGVNGCASLISAILATLLAIHFGFNWVVLIAIALYLAACLAYPFSQKN